MIQDVWTPQGQVSALMFVADLANENMRPDLSREEQVRFIAHGAGELGSSFDYVDGLITHFDLLGIDDPHLRELWRDAAALRGSLID
jgi:cation transport protein ChaC